MVLGIVGKIGSGKSAVVKYIEKNYDAIVFSCDEIAKEIMEKGESSYDPGFAGEIFINEKKQEECRTLLHPLVFIRIYKNILEIENKNNFLNNLNENNEDLDLKGNNCNLNNLLNKPCDNSNIMNKNNFDNILNIDCNENYKNKNYFLNKNNFSKKLIIIESALPSDEMFKMCDKVIYIDSPYEERVKRLKESRDYSESKTKLIYDSQKYYEKFYDRADYKIYNDGTKEELEEKVKEVLNEIHIACK